MSELLATSPESNFPSSHPAALATTARFFILSMGSGRSVFIGTSCDELIDWCFALMKRFLNENQQFSDATQLESTSETGLVEFVERSVRFGIGLGKSHEEDQNPRTWLGRNLLGFV